MFKGKIHGTFDYWGEYDESFDVLEFQALEVDAEYFYPGLNALDFLVIDGVKTERAN
ncbi:hypothetical protein M0R72_14660 [Candidatus Pacearchaeota archaeon]|nr:hypothetical protein [Candidatus Pacearchaeota archaeon]